MGRLLSIGGKGEGRLTLAYEGRQIARVTTAAGYVLTFTYDGERLVEIQDELGRILRYRYEQDCLSAVCHVDEGVTTYHYDGKGHIKQVIDQNGHAYVSNEYDTKGRVIKQYYLDGTKSELLYDMENQETRVFIEGLGRTERYRWNKDFLVTHTFYEDGTKEEVEYDQWSNRICERDRNGNETRRVYDAYGRILEETLPSGQRWSCTYDAAGNLISRSANSGAETRYAYDERGFVQEEYVLVKLFCNTLFDKYLIKSSFHRC